MNEKKGRAEEKKLIMGLLILLLTAVLIVAGTFISLLIRRSPVLATVTTVALAAAAAVAAVFILVTLTAIIMVYSGRGNTEKAGRLAKRLMNVMLYPVLGLGRLLGLDSQRIQRAYAAINNRVVYSSRPDVSAQDVLVLLPHCIQNSKCKHRLNDNIYNCAECGRCSVADVVKLGKRLGVKIRMVPGGTLARKTVAEEKPEAIVAVACERDLCSGIRDTSFIPVIGILNERPYGPCRDTWVDVNKVEEAIKFLCKRRHG